MDRTEPKHDLNMSDGHELVLALSRPIDKLSATAVNGAMQAVGNWDRFFAWSLAFDVEPVVMTNLREHFATLVPALVLARAAAREQASRSWAVSQALRVVHVANTLKARGIDAIVLKGPALGLSAYGDASMRTFADADLMVRRSDLEAARDVLISDGFAPDYQRSRELRLARAQHALEFSKSGLKVELHWSLVSRYLRFDIPVETLWGTAQTQVIGGSEIKVLARAPLFLYLCAHGAKHQWERVRWICDVAQLAARLTPADADDVMHLARQGHSVRLVALGLRVAQEVVGHVDTPLLGYGELHDPATAGLVHSIRGRLGLDPQASQRNSVRHIHPVLSPVIFWMRSRERAYDRAATLLHLLLVPTTEASGIGGWVQRPFRLLGRAFYRALRLLRS